MSMPQTLRNAGIITLLMLLIVACGPAPRVQDDYNLTGKILDDRPVRPRIQLGHAGAVYAGVPSPGGSLMVLRVPDSPAKFRFRELSGLRCHLGNPWGMDSFMSVWP